MTEAPERDAEPAARGEFLSDETSTATRWVLLDGDRRLVSAAILAAVAVLLLGLLAAGAGDATNPDAMTRLFTSLVGGNLTLITVAISINQLILSREFGTPDEIHDHITDIIEYRHEVEETVGAPASPVAPDEFLEFLAAQLHDCGEALREAARTVDDPQYRTAVEEYGDTLVLQAECIRAAIEERPAGAFHTLRTVLDTDFTGDVYAAELLRSREDQPESVGEALEEVFSLLEYMGVARQHFKTLYIQRELAGLSRKLLYVGVPAVALPVAAVWVYGHPDGATVGGPWLVALSLVATVVAAAPLAVLVAYVLRITTVTRKTASLMPFEVREESPL